MIVTLRPISEMRSRENPKTINIQHKTNAIKLIYEEITPFIDGIGFISGHERQ
jgi:hypothetical protein